MQVLAHAGKLESIKVPFLPKELDLAKFWLENLDMQKDKFSVRLIECQSLDMYLHCCFEINLCKFSMLASNYKQSFLYMEADDGIGYSKTKTQPFAA